MNSPSKRLFFKYGMATTFFALLLFFVFGCKKDTVNDSLEASYSAYFPLLPGSWIIYDVDSIVHLDGDDAYGVDTMIERKTYQLREEVDSCYIDAENDTTYRIIRYKRDDASLPWTFVSLWIAKRTPSSGQRVEENVRFVKLSFPVDPRVTWNGNAFNYLPEETYYYSDVHVPYTLQSNTFDSTVTVIQNDFTSNVNRIMKKEIYAMNVGMIEKQFDSLRLQPVGASFVILNGVEYAQKLNSYGR